MGDVIDPGASMRFQEYVSAARNAYITELKRAIESHDPCHVEPALRNESGDLVMDGMLQLPCRLDLVVKSTGASVMVDSTTRADFANAQIECDGATVELTAFAWECARFHVHRPRNRDWTALRSAFEKWFDIEDANEQTVEGCFGVIHYISDPSVAADSTNIVVDFGSAPEEAFYDVLGALCAMRPSRIVIE